MKRRVRDDVSRSQGRSRVIGRCLLALSAALLGCGSPAAQPPDGSASDAKDGTVDLGIAPDAKDGTVDLETAPDAPPDEAVSRDANDVLPSTPWQDLTPTPLPPAWPNARINMAMAIDTARQKLMVFGGYVSAVTDELWEWDIAAGGWTSRTVSPRPAAWPVARFLHAMAFDERRMKLVVFGGSANGPNLGDTWEWDATLGTWENRGTGTHPFNRANTTLVYDPTGLMVLFGGAGDGGLSQELWEWDGSAGTWRDRTPAQVPSAWPAARQRHGAAYDAARMKMMIFGGEPYAGDNVKFDDVWQWDRATQTWTSRTPTPRPAVWPAARTYPGLTFAEVAGTLVFYSGISGSGIGATSELWTFDPRTGSWTSPTPSPLPVIWPARRVGHSVAYDASTDSVYVFGGQSLNGLVGELWRLDAAKL